MKISIITTSYNYAKYIEETIQSVINQTYENWELIIVDDGSSDNSVDIIKSYCEKDSRIKLFQHADNQNKGLKETLLSGIKHASGDWITFLESDDYFSLENFAKKVEIVKKYPDAKLIFNKVKFLSEEKRKQQKNYERIQEKLSKMKFPKNMFYDFSMDNMILTFSCVMVEANAIKNTDFNTPIDSTLDKWLWIHLAYKNDFYYLDEELTSWRLHSKSYIKKGINPILRPTQMQAYYDIYDKEEKSLKLFFFIIFSYIKLLFIRGFSFLRNIMS